MATESDKGFEERLSRLECLLERICQRNNRVEAEKAWETSRIRLFCVLLSTYILTALVFWLIEVERPLSNAFIPTVAYFVSTQSLPVVKKRWLRWLGRG